MAEAVTLDVLLGILQLALLAFIPKFLQVISSPLLEG
jgi:hypothetical protein